MKELNTFRQFLNEGPDDINIMGQKFNFNDICPGAHKVIGDLAKEYANDTSKLGDLILLANYHEQFFNLEKKALGPQGIDVDDLDDVKELYVKINNTTSNAFGDEVGKEVKTYMDMHMDKIKGADLKASKPGGSSDMNFSAEEKANVFVREEEGLEENDKALDEILEEGKVKDFLLKILLKTTGVVSPDTLKYVYSELIKQVGEDEANETFQEFGLDPSKYKK